MGTIKEVREPNPNMAMRGSGSPIIIILTIITTTIKEVGESDPNMTMRGSGSPIINIIILAIFTIIIIIVIIFFIIIRNTFLITIMTGIVGISFIIIIAIII